MNKSKTDTIIKTSKPVSQNKNEEPRDYFVKFQITDRKMKPRHLNFTKTTERVNWIEEIEVNEAESEMAAVLSGTVALAKYWKPKNYDIVCVSIKEKLIQVPRLILPKGVRI